MVRDQATAAARTPATPGAAVSYGRNVSWGLGLEARRLVKLAPKLLRLESPRTHPPSIALVLSLESYTIHPKALKVLRANLPLGLEGGYERGSLPWL